MAWGNLSFVVYLKWVCFDRFFRFESRIKVYSMVQINPMALLFVFVFISIVIDSWKATKGVL